MDSIFIREATADDLEVILHHRVAMFYDMGLTDPSALQAKQAAAAPYYTQDSAKALITDGWPSMHGAEWWAAAASDSSPGRRTRNIPSRTRHDLQRLYRTGMPPTWRGPPLGAGDDRVVPPARLSLGTTARER